ncbi:HET-domain-containing protein [Botrytis cinerea]
MDPYQYQSINLGRPSIRLLQLHKGHWSDKIRGHFISAWFDDPDSIIPYSALSYTWGYIDKVEEVIIDSARIKVTFNLHMALMHLRSQEEDQIFWIDALCINQENFHEKIHQIRQMGDIYKKAEKVVIWLGRGTEETDLVMDAMKRLRKASLSWHSAEWRDKASGWVDENNEHLSNLREQMRLILDRPWFRRIWILQEVANARRSTTVHCGNKSISATIFSQFPALVALNPPVHVQSVLDIMPGISRNESWWAQGQKLQTLILKFRESEATDDRDKIYALLGMSSDTYRSNILNSKYDKSSQQVIREAVSFILSENYSQLVDDVSLYQFIDWSLTKFLDNIEDLEGAMLMDAFEGAEEGFLKLLIETDVCRISSRGFFDRTPVHWAVQREQPTILKMLLDPPLCSFEKVDSFGQNPLSLALQTGNAKIVELLLDAGAKTEDIHFNGQTPLWLAIQMENARIVALLLDKCAEIEEGHLMLAVEKEIVDIVDLLVQRVTKSRAKNMAGYGESLSRPLLSAIDNENYDIIKLLLDHGAEISVRYLQLLFTQSRNRIVEFLIDYGAEIDATASQSQTALLLAVRFEKINSVRSLIKMGVALEVQEYWGRTPLTVAADNGHYELVKLLLENGAELSSRDGYGETALIKAIVLQNQQMVELLLEKHTEFHDREIHYREAFTTAVKSENKEAIELLLEKGVDFERKDEWGDTGLLKAIEQEYSSAIRRGATRESHAIVELLLRRGADIEAKNKFGRTALAVAVMNGRVNVTRLLIGKGAKLETQDDMGRTPLQNAMISNDYWLSYNVREEVVAILLAEGAKLETRDQEGKTPLQNAIMSDWSWTNDWYRQGIVTLLLKNGAKLETRDQEGKTPLQNAMAACRGERLQNSLRFCASGKSASGVKFMELGLEEGQDHAC